MLHFLINMFKYYFLLTFLILWDAKNKQLFKLKNDKILINLNKLKNYYFLV